MTDRTNRALSIYATLILLLSSRASLFAADQILKIPFEYATGRNALLVHVRINDKPALLVLDTGSPQTVLQPNILGLKPADLAKRHRAGDEIVGGSKAISQKVELRVGSAVWTDWPVKVMDQAQALSNYLDNPDGVLGIDFLQEFSSIVFDLDDKTIVLNRSPGQSKRRLSGNLRNFNFSIHNGQYILNDIVLERVSGGSVDFSTRNESCRVRINFQKTVLVTKGEPVDSQDKELVQSWAQSIPLVAEVLQQQSAHGSLKPLVYTLISPKNATDIQIREQITLLWSADPTDKANIGHTGFGLPMHLAKQLIDVQYRELSNSLDHSISKIMLQILHIQNGGSWTTLGALVIASNASGEYEFYLVPPDLLEQIVISKEKDETR